jgi:hypothetical protein
MSDVEAVSLPAALDVGQNRLATVKPDPVDASSPGKARANSYPRADSDGLTGVHSEGEEDGPPSPRADSEAETIIQSGRESLSPEKKRKHIKHDPSRHELNGTDGHQRKKPRVFGDTREREREKERSLSPSHRATSPSVVKIEKDDSHMSETEGVANGIDRASEIARAFRKRSLSDSAEEQRDPILCGSLNIPIVHASPGLHPTRDHSHPVDHLTNDLLRAPSFRQRRMHQPPCSQALGDKAPKIDNRHPPLKVVLHCRGRICGSLALESVRPRRLLSKWDQRNCVTRVAGLLLRGRAPIGNMIK